MLGGIQISYRLPTVAAEKDDRATSQSIAEITYPLNTADSLAEGGKVKLNEMSRIRSRQYIMVAPYCISPHVPRWVM